MRLSSLFAAVLAERAQSEYARSMRARAYGIGHSSSGWKWKKQKKREMIANRLRLQKENDPTICVGILIRRRPAGMLLFL